MSKLFQSGGASSSAEGGRNYLADTSSHNAENGVGNWTTYADAAGEAPVDGTGGSPSGLSMSDSSNLPLRGSYSFDYNKSSGTDKQGTGASCEFTIDAADRCKVLQLSFDYTVNQGTYADDDIRVWIYDVGNGVLIQPSSYKLKSNGTANHPGIFTATFQTSTATSYRLILHIGSTTTSTFQMKIDNFKVGPQQIALGAPITDWQSYTPAGSWVSNTSYAGKWRRVGDSMELYFRISTSGAPTAATLTVDIPSGYTIDQTKLAHSVFTNLEALGTSMVYDSSGTTKYVGVIGPNNTTSVRFHLHAGNVINATAPITFAADDWIEGYCVVPITGWSSSVQMSTEADTRVVAMRAQLTTTQTGVTDKVIPFNSAAVDTHGAMNTTTGVYTVPVSGEYLISARALISELDGSTNSSIAIRKNSSAVNQSYGSVLAAGATSSAMHHITDIVRCSAGDTLDIYIDADASFDIDSSSARTAVQITRISGPAQIAASETVAARYTTAAGQSISDDTVTIVDFGTKTFDSHGSVTTGASWKFTAPISGKYSVKATILLSDGGGWAAGELYAAYIFKNAGHYSSILYGAQAAHATYQAIVISDEVQLLAGEYIDIRVYQNSGAALTMAADANRNRAAIARIGNY